MAADRDLADNRPEAQPTRGFLFSDLRGYTAYVEANGAAAGARVLDAYRARVRSAVERHRGAEIRTEGDSFFVVFPSVSSAVACGLAIQAAGSGTDGPGVGVGIHAGETIDTGGGFVGSAVNIAARVCAVARPGEVLVTDTVRSLTQNVLDVRFVPRGRRQLKGVAEPVILYSVQDADGTAVGMPRRGHATRSLAAIGGTGLAAAVAVGAIVVVTGLLRPGGAPRAGGTGSSSSPSTVASPSQGRSPAVSVAPTLTGRELEILPHVPALYKASCVSAPGLIGRAQIACTVPDVGRITYILFDSVEGMRAEYAKRWGKLRDEAHVPGIEVCPEPTYSRPAYGSSGTQSGEIVCYHDVGRANIVWTDEGQRIISIAIGDEEISLPTLVEWWERREAGPLQE